MNIGEDEAIHLRLDVVNDHAFQVLRRANRNPLEQVVPQTTRHLRVAFSTWFVNEHKRPHEGRMASGAFHPNSAIDLTPTRSRCERRGRRRVQFEA